MKIRSAAAMLAFLLAAGTHGQASSLERKPVNPDIDEGMIRAGFLNSHPDLRYRMLGLEERKQGDDADAHRFFLRAAYYGDKPSQGMVAEMLWNGTGVARDRAAAYAWMDLAAERGYRGFLILREQYWNALDEQERNLAITRGEAIYASYGDAATQPRLATVLRRERRRMTGSRTGFAGTLKITVPGPAGPEEIDGSKFYDEKFWKPELYRAWHDGIWMTPRIGKVSVGEVETVGGETPGGSRIPAVEPAIEAREPTTPPVEDDGPGTPTGG